MPGIRAVALCIFRRLAKDGSDEFLFIDHFDHGRQLPFWRPLGGSIEPGERAIDAVRREVHEELGADIEDVRQVAVLENIFEYLGEAGHEIVFVFEARFVDAALYEGAALPGEESDGVAFTAVWTGIAELCREERPLFPDGLLGFLLQNARR